MENVVAEPQGFVLISRYRRSPQISFPSDPKTGEPLVDLMMSGQVPGAKVVFARTTIESDRDETKRMLFGYVNGAVIYANGRPLFFGTDTGGGTMNLNGDGVYVPLRKGANEIVFAVTNFTGGWGFWADRAVTICTRAARRRRARGSACGNRCSRPIQLLIARVVEVARHANPVFDDRPLEQLVVAQVSVDVAQLEPVDPRRRVQRELIAV